MVRLKSLISAQTKKNTTGDFIDSRMCVQSACGLYYETVST